MFTIVTETHALFYSKTLTEKILDDAHQDIIRVVNNKGQYLEFDNYDRDKHYWEDLTDYGDES